MEPKHTVPRHQYEWSEERAERAARLFKDGVLGADIACELGCSRGAVMGKLSRMGIKRKDPEPAPAPIPKPKARLLPNRNTINARAARPAHPEERHRSQRHVAPKGTRKRLLSLGDRDCRWPCGNPGDKDFWFCGAPQADGAPYCAKHCCIAFTHPSRKLVGGGQVARNVHVTAEGAS